MGVQYFTSGRSCPAENLSDEQDETLASKGFELHTTRTYDMLPHGLVTCCLQLYSVHMHLNLCVPFSTASSNLVSKTLSNKHCSLFSDCCTNLDCDTITRHQHLVTSQTLFHEAQRTVKGAYIHRKLRIDYNNKKGE
ncbi:hypothetical protein FVEG_17034 [Fusarium verticillioides 7600]|uniref:Uncharacterized protein n=1 Tax=Gibberella moniliformis (strain M3125 / FGSC 7600) TaxID=334819 RepID=W7MYI6_GIBM7|nr:hypothetical protein FVEG_17034 [Fusarium verticillioides 7600]XP_018759066.1 hypothetical protein FVEG_17034 [Fusarium verticillioides 7600]EWG52874.1 hypothetical protein FVEG_17034 [Fusarium verticillioides 7600]EWG52875.1 hypothetical protein FVEG_17034 [Fusarium verticillioides 7600]